MKASLKFFFLTLGLSFGLSCYGQAAGTLYGPCLAEGACNIAEMLTCQNGRCQFAPPVPTIDSRIAATAYAACNRVKIAGVQCTYKSGDSIVKGSCQPIKSFKYKPNIKAPQFVCL